MEQLAKAIKLAMKLREDSFMSGSLYSISLRDAADKAAEQVGYDTRGTDPIYFLLVNSWNEICQWAESYALPDTDNFN